MNQAMKVEGPLHVVCQCDKCKAESQEPVVKLQEPVGWISNKDFEPIRIRIMQEAYELADSNDPEGYNAIKVMCGDVQKMLSPQRTWVGLTDEDLKLLSAEWRIVYGAWMDDFARDIEAKLKERNI